MEDNLNVKNKDEIQKTAESDFKKFDVILSSETIYNPSNYKKICNIIKELLQSDGIAYIAAKSIYFGVGGSTKEFSDYILNDHVLQCEVCWSTNEGMT